MTLPSLILMICSSFVSGLGDVLCRHAAVRAEPKMVATYTLGAALCWASCALIWLKIYRSHSILEMVIMYTPFHSVASGFVGVLIFGDAFTPKLAVGAVLSMVAIWVMS